MINKINNEHEFLEALKRIDSLMFKAVPGTPEGDELELLSKLIEEYENRNSIVMGNTKVSDSALKDRYRK